MAKVNVITEVTGYELRLSAEEAKQFYDEIARALATIGIHSPESRDKMNAPMLYGVYDGLNKAGAAGI